MKETSKARAWREELGYFKKYIKGKGIDIGCGSGHMLQKVKGKFQELYGMDISPSRLQEAKIKIENPLRALYYACVSLCLLCLHHGEMLLSLGTLMTLVAHHPHLI
jgi:2-polyprenyl-3-methyl-5-hydroxy-6-metoxy-1,4-benzoquinol methylase